MRDLPFDLRFEFAGKRVRLVHGSLRKRNECLFEDKPARTFERIATLADADVLVFGHTHKPWVREYGGVLFVNCGSVGKPKDGDPRAAFAILRERGGDIDVAIERVPYGGLSVDREMRAVGLPADLAERLVGERVDRCAKGVFAVPTKRGRDVMSARRGCSCAYGARTGSPPLGAVRCDSMPDENRGLQAFSV